jgi:hypothetical protein
VLKLTLHLDSYDWEFVPIAGQTFTDVGSGSCVNLGPTPTPTDTGTPSPAPTASDTPAPSDTPTPTDTNTPGPSPTPTDTLLPGPTATWTEVSTPAATHTPLLPTDTPSPTPTPQTSGVPALDSVSSGITAGTSLSLSHTTSGSERVVGVSINNDNLETVASISYAGMPFSLVGSVNHQGSGGDDSRVEIWKLVDPPIGTQELLITFSADLLRYAVIGAVTLTGVDRVDPLGSFASSYADSASASVAVPSAPGELVLAVFSCETCTSMSFTPPAVGRWGLVAGGGNTIGAGASVDGDAAQLTLSASLGSSDHWAMGGVSIRPAPDTGATPTPATSPTLTPSDTPAETPTEAASPTDTPAPIATYTPGPTSTDTPPSTTDTPAATHTPTPSNTSTSTPAPPGEETIYLSSTSGGTVGGVSFADEDILAYDIATATWSMVFDGSDVGLGGTDVDAFSLLSDGSIVISIDSATYTISGLGNIEDRDVVRFIPTSLGPDTAGSFEWYLDGSDVGLTTSGEDIDALDFAADGRLLLSTQGSFGVSGASGADEDLVAFTATSSELTPVVGSLLRRIRRWPEQLVLRGHQWGVGGLQRRDLPERSGGLCSERGERRRRRPIHLHAQPVGLDHGLHVPQLLDCRRLRMGRGGHRRDSTDQALNRFSDGDLRRLPSGSIGCSSTVL